MCAMTTKPVSDPRCELRERATAAYLGLAIGDALGATVEFMTPREIEHQYGVHSEILGGGWLKLKPGQVTDDTTMSLALGEVIMEDGAVKADSCARALLQWMRNKPVDIGNTVRRGLVRYRHSGTPHGPPSEHDAGNGACMRTLPVALFLYGASGDQIRQASAAQAHITHHNELSDAASCCTIELIHRALDGADTVTLLHEVARPFIERWPMFRFRGQVRSNPSGYIVDTMQLVFQGLFDTDNFEDCLIDVVNRGGDADTTGAIAGMIAGAVYGRDAIPPRWLKGLDKTIRLRCEGQAVALIESSDGYKRL